MNVLTEVWTWLVESTTLGAFFVRLALVAGLPLGVPAYFFRIFPHRLLVYLALVPAALSLGLLYWPEVARVLVLLDVAIGLLAFGDLLTLPRRKRFEIRREVGRVASLKHPHPVTLTISNLDRRERFLWIRDDVPTELDARPDEFLLRLTPRSRAVLRYQLHATRRGAFVLPAVHVRARSLLGLWRRYLTYPAVNQVHVYPDLKQLEKYAILARTNRLNLLGLRRTRQIGQDNEFERLRDYTPDDNYRRIDWRSTARRHRLTVKDYQANQSQRLIFLLDCGRMMTAESDGISLLDHALNSMLMLSYVALRRGDAVGLICFSDEIHSFVPPESGMNQMNRLLHASFDRFPRLVESRYDQAFLYLATHCRKRSLVILMSNLIDEVNANQVERHLATLTGRHLPLGVLLRDHRLFEMLDVAQDSADDDSLYRAAAAADIVSWREQVLADLAAKGVRSLDVFPENLTAPLVNQYLEIKARHLL